MINDLLDNIEKRRNTRKIKLTRGLETIVDYDDSAKYGHLKWRADSSHCGLFRVVRSIWIKDKKRSKNIFLHREIMKAKPSECVDHINGNPLDNRKENLRICSKRDNCRNAGKRNGRSSTHFKGISKIGNRWRAIIHDIHIGCFATPEEAAIAYDFFCLFLHGEFARTNAQLEKAAKVG